MTAEQRAIIEAEFPRFERERPGQRATLAGVLRTLALEWATAGGETISLLMGLPDGEAYDLIISALGYERQMSCPVSPISKKPASLHVLREVRAYATSSEWERIGVMARGAQR